MNILKVKSGIFLTSLSISLILTGCGQIQSAINSVSDLSQTVISQKATTDGSIQTIVLNEQSSQNNGNLKLLWKAVEKTFSTLATEADIDKMKIKLSGPSIESINNGQALEKELDFGVGGLGIQNIPEGTVNITTSALDENGKLIGSAEAGNIQITPGQTSQVNLVLNLKDELLIEEVTNTGDLGLAVSVVDGQVITETKVVDPEGGYAQFNQNGPPPPPKDGECPPPPPIPKEVMDKIAAEAPELIAELEALKGMEKDEHHAKMTELATQYPQYFKAPPPMPEDGSCPPPPPKGDMPPPPPSDAGEAQDGPPPPPKDGECPPPPPIPKEVMDKIAAEAPELIAELEALKGMEKDEHHAKMTELATQYPQYFKAPPPMPEDGSCPPPPPKGDMPPPPPGR